MNDGCEILMSVLLFIGCDQHQILLTLVHLTLRADIDTRTRTTLDSWKVGQMKGNMALEI